MLKGCLLSHPRCATPQAGMGAAVSCPTVSDSTSASCVHQMCSSQTHFSWGTDFKNISASCLIPLSLHPTQHRHRLVRVTASWRGLLCPWRRRRSLAQAVPFGSIPSWREAVATDASQAGDRVPHSSVGQSEITGVPSEGTFRIKGTVAL